jgi:hydrogenase/urease accessory protein HupE
MRRLQTCLTTLWAIFSVLTSGASAHELNMTGVKVKLNKNDVSVSVVAHLHQLKSSDVAAEITRRLKLRLDNKAFVPSNPQLMRDPANGIVIWQATQPTTANAVALDAPLFPEQSEQTTVLTVLKDRQVLDEAVVDAQHPAATIGKKSVDKDAVVQSTASKTPTTVGTVAVMQRFLREGIAHIFLGPDHVLFLLTLLLLGGTWQQLLKIVTAFTFAHSITLSLAATSIFSLPPRFVEPVIALSIIVVAATNLRARKTHEEAKPRRDVRPWLALGFGLIHGFGFAGALAEVGLPRESLGWALLAFNGGVEIGQAILVLAFAPTLAAIVKWRPRLQFPVVQYGSASVAIMGTVWFVQRLLTA